MKPAILAGIALMLLTAGAPIAANADEPAAKPGHSHAAKTAVPGREDVAPGAHDAIRVVERFGAALHSGDLKAAGALLDPKVLVLESGGAERNRDEYMGHHAISDAAFLKGTHSVVKGRTARLEGNLAWVGTESELHATKDGKPMTLLSTETMVLRRTGSEWRIVHIHWSSRPKKQAAR